MVVLVRLLNAGDLEVLHNHLRERLPGPIFGVTFFDLQRVNQFIILVHAEDTMRTQALNSEGAGYPYFFLVFIRFVV